MAALLLFIGIVITGIAIAQQYAAFYGFVFIGISFIVVGAVIMMMDFLIGEKNDKI